MTSPLENILSNAWLERLASIQYMVEFGDQMVEGKAVKDFIPGWYKGVKKFGNMASLKDLNEVICSMKELLKFFGEDYDHHPVYLIVRIGHVKLMELLFHTDFDMNQSEYYNPFFAACSYDHTEVVNLMINSSKDFGIDLNARNFDGWTGFMQACFKGYADIVNLMVNSSKDFGIDLNARNAYGETGFMIARRYARTEVVNLMVNASEEFNINISRERVANPPHYCY